MDRNCPICKKQLMKEHKIKHIDYHCFPPKNDHHYAERFKDETLQEKLAIKVRLSPTGSKIFFSQNYPEQYMEVWCEPDAVKSDRIKVNSLFEPNFEDLDGLFQKLKTYLVFS